MTRKTKRVAKRDTIVQQAIAGYLQAEAPGQSMERVQLLAGHPDLPEELQTYGNDHDQAPGWVKSQWAPAPESPEQAFSHQDAPTIGPASSVSTDLPAATLPSADADPQPGTIYPDYEVTSNSVEDAQDADREPGIDRDLETACLPCLQKDPEKRHATAEALADDIEHFQAGEPILARPIGTADTVQKRVRRPVVVGLLLALCPVTLSGIGVFAWAFSQTLNARDDAINEQKQTAEALQVIEKARKQADGDRKKAEENKTIAEQARQQAEIATQEMKNQLLRSEWLVYTGKMVMALREWQDRKQADGDRKKTEEAKAIAEQARQQAEIKAQEMKQQLLRSEWLVYTGKTAMALREWQDHNVDRARQLLDACRLDFRHWEHAYLRRLLDGNQRTFRGPSADVSCVAYSPDGQRIASGSRDGTARMWNVATGQVEHTFARRGSSVWNVAFSPDGQRLAVGYGDGIFPGQPGEVKLWDVMTGQEERTIRGHKQGIYGLAFSPDGKRLATASWDSSVKVWNLATGAEENTLTGHFPNTFAAGIHSVAFSLDGKHLATGGRIDGTVMVWDLVSGKEFLSLKGHTAGVHALAFSPDGKSLASGSDDHTVKVWDLPTGKERLLLKGKLVIMGVTFSPDSKRLATAGGLWTLPGFPGGVKVWDSTTGDEILTLRGHSGGVSGVAFSPDGKHLATSGGDGAVKIWNITRAQGPLSTKFSYAGRVIFSPDSKQLACINGSQVMILDAATGAQVQDISLKGKTLQLITSAAFSPDGKRLATGSGDLWDRTKPGDVKIWDLQGGQEILSIQGHISRVTDVAFSPCGKRLASAGADENMPSSPTMVKVWDTGSGREVLALPAHIGWVSRVTFNPDGSRLATFGGNAVTVCDATTGKQLLTVKEAGISAAFSPDGQRLAIASGLEVKIWDTVSGQEVHFLKGHTQKVATVAFSPDGKRLATGSDDRTIKLWDAATGQETISLKGHIGNVVSVAFSPDGQRLASASHDGVINIWDGTPLPAAPAPANKKP